MVSVGCVLANGPGFVLNTCPFFSAVPHDADGFLPDTVGTWDIARWELARSHSTGLMHLL